MSDSELASREHEDEPLLQANIFTEEMLGEMASAIITPRFVDCFSFLLYLIFLYHKRDWTFAFMLKILLLKPNVCMSSLGAYGIWFFPWMVVPKEKIVLNVCGSR